MLSKHIVMEKMVWYKGQSCPWEPTYFCYYQAFESTPAESLANVLANFLGEDGHFGDDIFYLKDVPLRPLTMEEARSVDKRFSDKIKCPSHPRYISRGLGINT